MSFLSKVVTYGFAVVVMVLDVNLAMGAKPPSPTNTPPTGWVICSVFLDVGDTGTCQSSFRDSDRGDSLTYTVNSANEDYVTARVDSAGLVTVRALRYRSSSVQITVTAIDRSGARTSDDFSVFLRDPTPLPEPRSSILDDGPDIGDWVAGALGLGLIIGVIANLSNRTVVVGLAPEISFDLDRNDTIAFYTHLDWANASDSNWQLRGGLRLHTKYSGELLDWNANSHIGYQLRGKWGSLNPYAKARLVANARDAEIQQRYSLGLDYQLPNRFAVSVTQPKLEANNYTLGVSYQGASKIRYQLSGETQNNIYRLTGEYSF